MNFRQDDLHIYDIKGKTRGAEGGIYFPGANIFFLTGRTP